MEFKCLNKIRPNCNVWYKFVTEVTYTALKIDFPKSRTHPVEIDCIDPELIRSYFDSISYLKGASVLRMLETLMGEQKFDEAINAYLNKFMWKTVTSNDFFEVMNSFSEINIQKIMETWTKQPGYPLVTVEKVSGNCFKVSQRPYDINHDAIWSISINYITDTQELGSILLTEPEGVIEIEAKWIKINHLSKSFYRVLYTSYNELFEDIKKLSADDRFGIVQDSLFHFKNRLVDFDHIKLLIDSLIPEYDYSIVLCLTDFLIEKMSTLNGLLSTLSNLLLPLWERFGLRENPEDLYFSSLKVLYISKLLSPCRNENVSKEILNIIEDTGEYQRYYNDCVIALCNADNILDIVGNNIKGKSILLEHSNNLDLMTNLIKNSDLLDDSYSSELFRCTYRRFNRYSNDALLRALVLNYLEIENNEIREILLALISIFFQSLCFLDNPFTEFVEECIKKVDNEPENSQKYKFIKELLIDYLAKPKAVRVDEDYSEEFF